MPLIEFVGYSEEEQVERVERYTPLLVGLPYAHHTIFAVSSSSRVVAVEGHHPPFLRVSSRYRDRIDDMLRILGEFEDIEFSTIEYREVPR